VGGGIEINVAERFRIHFYDELDSTQNFARDRVSQGRAVAGDVFAAKRQTAGYGRRGRGWDMAEGNLAVTWVEDFSSDCLAWIGYAVSLGLYDACKHYLPEGAAVTLKWPNDVLIDGGKASGILIESCGDVLLVGVGVNLRAAPVVEQKTACLSDFTALAPGPADFLDTFLRAYARWFDMGKTQGFPGIRRDWLVRAHHLNAVLTARLADGRVLTGVFVDLDPSGALLLNTEEGLVKITAADIFISGHHDQKTRTG